jgi:RHS repeat-associated protein
MGSVTAILDDEGNVIEHRNYDAFGAMTCMTPDGTSVATSPTSVDVGFQGQIRDAVSGLYQMGFRWYNPSLGRWLSRDPIGLNGGSNFYVYAENMANNLSDSSGLRTVDVYIWDADITDSSVGHMMMTEHDCDIVITSQFPHLPGERSSWNGPNTRFTFDETYQAEKFRHPSAVFVIDIVDDEAFDNATIHEVGKPIWSWCPTSERETQCTVAAWNAIAAGKIRGAQLSIESGVTFPGNVSDRLKNLAKTNKSVRDITPKAEKKTVGQTKGSCHKHDECCPEQPFFLKLLHQIHALADQFDCSK